MKLRGKLREGYKFLVAYGYYWIGVVHRYVGNSYGSRWEYEAAVEAFNHAVKWKPDFAQVYLDRGILYWRELDHPRKAIHDLTRAMDLDPHLDEAQFNRAIAHQQLREYAEAIADFQGYLAVGVHPYWREHAESMIRELSEWVLDSKTTL
ncbi:MAG TPA: tetratricopeptide repeat protein [Anaerolineae bacterium]|nr:tetratricopeptide repeat protein [Anaerolineae bacterium]HQH37146.1 tetratricopeptide repeat protein [Anaerolineae bacterium]